MSMEAYMDSIKPLNVTRARREDSYDNAKSQENK